MKKFSCILCGSRELTHIDERHIGVTSDCRPWPRAGSWMVCNTCGHVQKKLDQEWYADIHRIYATYEMYPLSDGNEQVVFKDLRPSTRTSQIMEHLTKVVKIKEEGCLLDIGCGNGALLKTFGNLYPKLHLYGYEQNDVCKKDILSLKGVIDFYYGSIESISHQFDMITMLYVIEHLTNPLDTLRKLKNLLSPDGVIMIQTSNFLENPFDLVVIDHSSHFSLHTLQYVAKLAGFASITSTDQWVNKEISIVIRDGNYNNCKILKKKDFNTVVYLKSILEWLHIIVEQTEKMSAMGNLGIFGTAIAGSWMANALKDKVKFFVDEDPLRHGKKHMGLPVFKPEQIPFNSSVYLAFPPNIAKPLFHRLKNKYPSTNFIVPPDIEIN